MLFRVPDPAAVTKRHQRLKKKVMGGSGITHVYHVSTEDHPLDSTR